MKANRKFIEDGEAVSAVIGVILMVAITVAIAATVYVYVSGMLTPASTGKTISALQTGTGTQNVTYKVTNADAGITWSQVTVSWDGGGGSFNDYITGPTGADNIAVGDYFTIEFGDSGTFTPDLIYEGSIIWTGSTVSV